MFAALNPEDSPKSQRCGKSICNVWGDETQTQESVAGSSKTSQPGGRKKRGGR